MVETSRSWMMQKNLQEFQDGLVSILKSACGHHCYYTCMQSDNLRDESGLGYEEEAEVWYTYHFVHLRSVQFFQAGKTPFLPELLRTLQESIIAHTWGLPNILKANSEFYVQEFHVEMDLWHDHNESSNKEVKCYQNIPFSKNIGAWMHKNLVALANAWTKPCPYPC